jgi:hypothetical protein
MLGLLNFAADDLARHIADVSGRGLATGAIEMVNKGVQLSAITDPDRQQDHLHRELPYVKGQSKESSEPFLDSCSV